MRRWRFSPKHTLIVILQDGKNERRFKNSVIVVEGQQAIEISLHDTSMLSRLGDGFRLRTFSPWRIACRVSHAVAVVATLRARLASSPPENANRGKVTHCSMRIRAAASAGPENGSGRSGSPR